MQKYIVEVRDNGDRFWYDETGKNLHRLDGPAVEYADGTKKWYIDGQRHRLDGPAIEYFDGYKAWFLEGKKYSEKNWKKKVNSLKNTCDGKTVEIDGVKYKLTIIK